MYDDRDYYGVLMSKIGGGRGWNNYGYGSTMKTGGRQTLTKGQAVKQASYADTFMRMSKAERRESIESNISTGNNGRYGTAKKTGAAGKGNLYNTMYGIQKSNTNVLQGAVKDEKKFKAADKNNIKSALGSSGSFGQKVGSNAGSASTAAANAVRYGTGSVLGNTGYYGNSGLYGLLGNYYGLAGGYGSSFGLSSYLNNWFA
jgi:hypothetical protein